MQGAITQIERNPKDLARWRKAQQQLLSGNHELALITYRSLSEKYPTIAELWFERGNAAAGDLDFEQANRCYQLAREHGAHHASLLGLIGQQYQSLRQLDDARSCYEQSLAVEPHSIDARINLAVWFEKERRLEEAFECVQICLAKNPRDDQSRYFHAFLLHRMKKHHEAETALRDLIHDSPKYPYVKYASKHLLGVVLDQLEQYDEAMHWLLAAKQQVRTITDTSVLELSYDQADQRRRALLASLTSDNIKRWRDEKPASIEAHQIAFLGGHPRSGTTLMEQILDAHPELLAFDEAAAFSQEITHKIKVPSHRDAYLDGINAPQRGEMRHRYMKSLLREISDASGVKILLDKNPSATMSLDVWLRIFPESKVIIALRDPRDVVVSCFFLNIMLNATNVNFLSMERTAKHYQDLMDVWLRMRDLGGFDWIETRYEDVVQDVASEGRKVTEFLGLDWHADQGRYYETARRKVLFAPTYHDVTQPIYTSAMNRWRRYEKYLEPQLEKLAPYCAAFGYS